MGPLSGGCPSLQNGDLEAPRSNGEAAAAVVEASAPRVAVQLQTPERKRPLVADSSGVGSADAAWSPRNYAGAWLGVDMEAKKQTVAELERLTDRLADMGIASPRVQRRVDAQPEQPVNDAT